MARQFSTEPNYCELNITVGELTVDGSCLGRDDGDDFEFAPETNDIPSPAGNAGSDLVPNSRGTSLELAMNAFMGSPER